MNGTKITAVRKYHKCHLQDWSDFSSSENTIMQKQLKVNSNGTYPPHKPVNNKW